MGKHDIAYKEFFSDPQNVEDLLRGFVEKDFIDELDFSTLKRVNGSFVRKEGGERHDDMVWHVRWKGRRLYIYLIMEFQSDVDYTMPVRIMSYMAELWLSLLNDSRTEYSKSHTLPPILPIVLYNGVGEWSAATDVADMICGSGAGKVSVDYYLIDELHPVPGRKDALDKGILNCVTAVFEVERTKSGGDLGEVLKSLSKKLDTKDKLKGFKTFLRFMRRFLNQRFNKRILKGFDNLEEMMTMTRDFTAIERAAGRAEGEAKGKIQILSSLVGKGILSAKQAAEELGISLSKFKAAAQKLATEQ